MLLPPLASPARLAATLLVLLALGCGGETPAAPAGTGWAVRAGADTTGAAAALGVFGTAAVAQAFERLAAQPYRAEVTMAELDPESEAHEADTLGVFARTLDVAPGRAPRAVSTATRGTLADSAGLDAARLLPRDPFPELVPDDVPFLDPRTRGAYRVGIVPTNIGDQVVAEVADPEADRPLVRSAVVWDQVGARRTLAVTRASASAIYDERSSASVELARGLGADPAVELPRHVAVHVETATPLQRRRFATEWRITPGGGAPVGAQPRTTNSREP